MALKELNSELNSHIQDAETQGDLKRIRELLTFKIAALDNLAMTNSLLDEAEREAEESTEAEGYVGTQNLYRGEENE